VKFFTDVTTYGNLASALENAPISLSEVPGFQIIFPQNCIEKIAEIEPYKLPFLTEMMKSDAGTTVQMYFFIPEKKAEEFGNLLEKLNEQSFSEADSDQSENIERFKGRYGEILQSLLKNIKWSALTLDVKTFTYQSTLETVSDEAAKETYDKMLELIDCTGDFVLETFQQQQDIAFLGPFMKELTKGFYRTYLPAIDGKKLTLTKKNNETGEFLILVGEVIANFVLQDYVE
ncbi:MAG: hypothetical protein ACRC2T_02155, partial [Thermoguttaceae bacterium]